MNMNMVPAKDSVSYFDGGMLGYIGISLLAFLIAVVTFGLGFPWIRCLQLRWITSHTVIDGQRLKFEGTGFGLFGNYIKWLLLTIITLGIYGFWLSIKLKEWEVKHTHFA